MFFLHSGPPFSFILPSILSPASGPVFPDHYIMNYCADFFI
ncbi:hypothetical protein OMAG_001927 [Candidatus Omnitrophus magneticus]|uniref:Uncharacterized protein n=1 Tax=Candidatus Omnitrophus magneticus TaxID=1609969 RepID=A0A0F0CQD0_9BACT|nr:hypothetical protein OMAG_001927 [Candidatus Omnitrophus magneticus]